MNEISKIIIPGNTVPYDLRDDYARERINNSHLFVVSPLMTGTIDIYTLLGRGVEPYEGLMLHILCANNNNDSITPTFIRLAATESPIEIEYSNFIRRRPINGGIYSFVLHYIPEEETTPAHWNFYPIDDTLKSKGVEIIEYTTEADAAYAQVKKALSQNILPVVHYIDTNADNYEYWLPLYEYATDKTGYIFSASTAYTSSEDISLSYIRINLDSTTWAIDNCGTNTVNIPTMTQAKGLFYGTCQTSNATAAKTVTGVADWPDSLFAGQTILIKFQHGNNVKENLTLSINGSTAAPIVTYDGVNPAAIWAAGSILLFIYSGTDWRLVDGAAGTTPDWAQNDPNGAGYIKNRCGGYDDVQTKESELLSLNCPADKNSAVTSALPSFFTPSAGDIISVTVDGSTKEYTLAEGTLNGASVLWFGTQNPSSITDVNAFFASDKWFGNIEIDESDIYIGVGYGSLSEIAGKTVGLKQRRVSVIPVKINRRYLDVPDWAKADSKPTYTASDVGAVPTDSVTTAVNAESTNENVPTAKAVYDALQNIDVPSGTDISLNVIGATVGQTIKVKAVDADGKPTAWEAVDMAAGDTEVWEKVCEVTTTENVSFIYQPFDGYYKKIRAIFLGESTAACQVWIYPNTETRPGGADIAYIFNAPYAAAGKYTIVGEFSTSPYPAPNSADNWYRGRCSVTREWKPHLHAGGGNSLFDNYVDDFYASLGEGSLAQGVKSLYWTHNTGEIKAGAQMVVYGVKA